MESGKLMAAGPTIDLDRLLKLRLVVARHGEMDLSKWWNTQGVLGRRGTVVLKRGFPSTHRFVQARIVFEVAASRCRELFSPPSGMTLWSLPAELEDRFQERWQKWMNNAEEWKPVFHAVESQSGNDLLGALDEFDLLSETQRSTVTRLRRSAENRAVPLSGTFRPDDDILTLLAAAFARGEPGNLAVPYARLEE